MSDIAYKVIVNNNGTDDIIFKTIMLKGNNGSSIASIEKTSTSGNVDTYTVYLDDGTVGGTFTVTNSDASSLNSLTDVTISSAQNGQALIYDGTAGKWKNADIAQSLADQSDVALSSLADGDSLVYDSATGKWKNEDLPDELSELGDVAISSAQSGEALIYNSVTGKWQNGDVVENLESLSDVAISSAQDGNVLAYDANTGKWSNINISIAQSLDDLTDVDITSASDGQALIYDANSGEWKNGSVSTVGSLDDLTDVDITSAVAGDSLRYDGSGWVNAQTTIECTQAQYDAWKNATPSQLKSNTMYVITNAPNLNATSEDLSYDGGATSTHDAIGTLSSLNTTEKGSLVGAVNEIDGKVKLSTNTLSVVQGANITLARSQIYKVGGVAFCTGVITATAAIPITTNLLQLPSGYTSILLTDFMAGNNAESKPFYVSNDKIINNAALTASSSYFFNFTFRI